MIPPKRSTFFSPWLGDTQKVYACSIFYLNTHKYIVCIYSSASYSSLITTMKGHIYSQSMDESYGPGMILGTYSTAVTHKYITCQY